MSSEAEPPAPERHPMERPRLVRASAYQPKTLWILHSQPLTMADKYILKNHGRLTDLEADTNPDSWACIAVDMKNPTQRTLFGHLCASRDMSNDQILAFHQQYESRAIGWMAEVADIATAFAHTLPDLNRITSLEDLVVKVSSRVISAPLGRFRSCFLCGGGDD